MKIIIPIAPRTKKNHSQIIKVKGRPRVIPSKQYREYEKRCTEYLRYCKYKVNYPVNIKALFYMPTHRRCDLTNLLEALDDVLVKHEVIEDDNFHIIAGHDGSRVLYDKDSPRTELWIERIEE